MLQLKQKDDKENDKIDEIKKLVKIGYDSNAESFQRFVDYSIKDLAIFKKFVSKLPKLGKVLDLGCGPGSISGYFFENGFDYYGVDGSDKQISLAQSHFPVKSHKFLTYDMFKFCQSQPDNSYDGILALFSIFHLPRETHTDLFKSMKRILKEKAPILFTAFDSDYDGRENDWLKKGTTMYWSNHKYSWYMNKLDDLGFKKVEIFMRNYKFAEEDVEQFFLMYTK